MDSRIIFNKTSSANIWRAIQKLSKDANRMDLAVSYIRKSGWCLIDRLLGSSKIPYSKARVLMTDQMMITQPSSLFDPSEQGVTFWKYVGKYTYHPKIYLFYNSEDQPIGAIVGSGNISRSGLIEGVEAAVYVDDRKELAELAGWIEEMLSNNFSVVTRKDLLVWQKRWFAAKKTQFRATRKKRKPTARSTEINTEIVEDILFMPANPIAILGFDHARNNIRSLSRAFSVLNNPHLITGKAKSELKLLGMLGQNQDLSPIGLEARKASDIDDFAYSWCKWVSMNNDKTLNDINPVIVSFKHAAIRFWKLQKDVREFFLQPFSRSRKELLQTIELLCNTSDLACELSLDGVIDLQATILNANYWTLNGFPQIQEYINNKGTRNWDSNDRLTMMNAWNRVQGIRK